MSYQSEMKSTKPSSVPPPERKAYQKQKDWSLPKGYVPPDIHPVWGTYVEEYRRELKPKLLAQEERRGMEEETRAFVDSLRKRGINEIRVRTRTKKHEDNR